MNRQPLKNSGVSDIAGTLEEGLRHHEAGRLGEARARYEAILALDPAHADGRHLLGLILQRDGRPDLAAASIRLALAIEPAVARYHNGLADVLRDLGRGEEALGRFRAARRLRPDSSPILGNLATALYDKGDRRGATTAYRKALALDPALVEGWYNLAAPLADAGLGVEAERAYRRALRLRPGFAEAAFNLGDALLRFCRPGDAEVAYRDALHLEPGYAQGCNNLGVALQILDRLDEAEIWHRAATCLDPGFPEASYNLGCLAQARNDLDTATTGYRRALTLRPVYGEARLALCMGQLPILYANVGEIAVRRRAYEEQLRRLVDEVADGADATALADAIGTSQPFFLAAQGQDDAALQRLYGALACRVLAGRHPPAFPPAVPARGRKIRVGLVSGFFHEHTIWRLFLEGWLKRLDRSRFEVFGYHTGIRRDGRTDMAAASCDRFTEGRRAGGAWRRLIQADAPHVLLYPEVGIDPMAGHLAAQRLAPVQCVSWGHPDTTGLPTMDYFLSGELMEPPAAESAYTERLIRLPNLATCFEVETWPPSPLDRQALGLRPGATVYWSGQALHKYLPQHDVIFPRIARGVEDAQFVFIAFARSRAVTDLFRARLARAFAAFGLRAGDHCVVLPSMSQARFIDAVRHSDVVLDTIGWSGGKSTLDGLAHDAPIVTFEGSLLRARHTSAILRAMGIDETIATSIDGYVKTAVRLGRDRAWRAALSDRIAANRHLVFADRGYIAALEDFLETAVRHRDSERVAA